MFLLAQHLPEMYRTWPQFTGRCAAIYTADVVCVVLRKGLCYACHPSNGIVPLAVDINNPRRALNQRNVFPGLHVVGRKYISMVFTTRNARIGPQ